MVLVAYILDDYSSILQTQFSNREGHEARRIGLETMPLDQHIEDRHGEREVVYLHAADNSIGPRIRYNPPVSPPSEGVVS